MTVINKANNKSKKQSMSDKYLPALIGLTLLLLTLGLSLFYIEGHFNLLSFSPASVFTLVGMLTLVVVIVLTNKRKSAAANANSMSSAQVIHNGSSNRAQWKKITIIFIMLLGSFAFLGLSHYLANSTNLRWDVTQSKQHTLSNQTVEFISALTEEVELTAFYVGLPPKYLQDLFKEYERLSAGLISTQIVDPIENIAFAAKFGNAVNANERKAIVQSVSGRKDVDFTDDVLTEEDLNNAISSASRAARQVYFLNGHGEYSLSNTDNVGLSKFKQLLTDNNIQSKPLMLGITKSIPADCDVLIIAGPRTELTKLEETLIVEYLTTGGDALFLIEHTTITTPDKPLTSEQLKQNPSLNSIINHWGLNVNSDIVIDVTNHVGDDVGSPATKNYQQHKAITQGLDYTFYVRPRSISMLEQRRPTIKLASIVSTASKDQSWGETNRNLDIVFDQGIDTPGPVPISFVVLEQYPQSKNVSIPYIEKSKPSDTRIIVFTDADFLTNVYIDQYSNAQMGLNVVNWLAELDYQVFVSTKEVKVERLDLTSKQKRQVVVILFLMPFFLFIAGIMVWLRAKAHR